jgi:hypothetical protein
MILQAVIIYIVALGVGLMIWRYRVMLHAGGGRATANTFAAALMSGILAGLLFGLMARLAMRLLALGMDAPLRSTVAGTTTVVLAFAGLGIALALPYPALFRTSRGGHPLLYALALTLLTLQPFIRAAAQDIGTSVWNPG